MNVEVNYSREASVCLPGGYWFGAFTEHSYVARVTFPDGYEVVIALPRGAASDPFDAWFDRVLANAAIMHSTGERVGYMVEGGRRNGLWDDIINERKVRP